MKKREAGVGDAAAESTLGGAARLELLDHGQSEAVAVVRAAVGEPRLGQGPDVLVGIEFGRIGREVFQAESGNPPAQVVNGGQAMQSQAIPEHDDGAAQRAQQVREEGADLDLVEVVVVPLIVEAKVLTNRADRETRDDRDAVVAGPVAQQRGLAARRPGAQHRGRQHEARFVYEDEVGPQPYGVFFTRGQTLRLQRAIAGSSRSRARRSGFWQLQPHCAKSRLTWLRW